MVHTFVGCFQVSFSIRQRNSTLERRLLVKEWSLQPGLKDDTATKERSYEISVIRVGLSRFLQLARSVVVAFYA